MTDKESRITVTNSEGVVLNGEIKVRLGRLQDLTEVERLDLPMLNLSAYRGSKMIKPPDNLVDLSKEGFKLRVNFIKLELSVDNALSPRVMAKFAKGYARVFLGRWRTYYTVRIEENLPEGCHPIYMKNI